MCTECAFNGDFIDDSAKSEKFCRWLNWPDLPAWLSIFNSEIEESCFDTSRHPSTASMSSIDGWVVSRVRLRDGFHCRHEPKGLATVLSCPSHPQMSTEVRNWAVVAEAMETAGATSSQMYVRAKALAEGKLDPMPTSFPEAPYSISAVAG